MLDHCISNRQIKLEIWRKTKEVQGNPVKERELATEFLTKVKEASEKRGLQALEKYGLYSRAADRLVGVVMSMAIYDSLPKEQHN